MASWFFSFTSHLLKIKTSLHGDEDDSSCDVFNIRYIYSYNSHNSFGSMPGPVLILNVYIQLLRIGIEAQYQWSCSPLDTANNQYRLPDLGIRDDGDVADISDRLFPSSTEVFIFPLPSSLSCGDGGTVISFQFCYQGSNFGTEQSIFRLLVLQQSGSTFTITNTVLVRSTPTDQICTSRSILLVGTVSYCCDTFTLDMADQFSLPASNFAFGTIASGSNLFLAYNPGNNDNSDLLVDHYRFNQGDFDATEGSTFTVDNNDLMNDRSVRLLQFFISKSKDSCQYLV